MYRITVKTLQNFEEELADELQALGAGRCQIAKRAVSFEGNKTLLYRVNLESRLALRVLVELHQFKAHDEASLYDGVRAYNWSQWLSAQDTLAVQATVFSEHFKHSQYVALKVKDAIVDQFRAKTGRRPSVDVQRPDFGIHIHIFKDECRLLMDSSGEPLFKRGYRLRSLEAPMSEVLAAGLLRLSRWDARTGLLDPMCGSGTLLAEAAMLATQTPPQWLREHFAFMRWPGYDAALWTQLRDAALARRCPSPVRLRGSDLSQAAIHATRYNLDQIDALGFVDLERCDVREQSARPGEAFLISNPPYDERLQSADIEAFYRDLGAAFKHRFPGYEAWIISAHLAALRRIGLKSKAQFDLKNGPLDCRFLGFELFKGKAAE